jgi:uncharacterized membrane protein YsdA (DUF1294 family)
MTIPQTIIASYLVLVNLAAFVMVGWDKRKAKKDQYRTREMTLWKAGAIGGILGMLIGMRLFRHKARKASFLVVTVLLVIWNIALAYVGFVYVAPWL